jgi:parallel beta-helix repeat protein
MNNNQKKKRKGVIIILFCIILLINLTSICNSFYSSNRIIFVDDDNVNGPWEGTTEYPFRYIQDAIDFSLDNDIIFVVSGSYFEDISISKSITIIGEDRNNTIIEGDNWIVNIYGEGVELKNFTITSHDKDFGYSTGVVIHGCNHVIIDNIINGGVKLYDAQMMEILNNSFFNGGLSFNRYGNDLILNNKIINNTVNNKPLVYFEGKSNEIINNASQVVLSNCRNILIENLEISDFNEPYDGIHLLYCNNCTIRYNYFKNNCYDIRLRYSNQNAISSNVFTSNSWSGISFFYAHNNKISKNKFYNEFIDIGYSNINEIITNEFIKSGISFLSAYNNKISYNNFLEPVDRVYNFDNYFDFVNCPLFLHKNCFTNNYWNSTYKLYLHPIFSINMIYVEKLNKEVIFPFFYFDWHPASEPYNIRG